VLVAEASRRSGGPFGLTFVGLRAERSLVLLQGLPQLQHLRVLLGVGPLQVLHVVDHHLHRLADAVLLEEGENKREQKRAGSSR